MKPSKIFSTFPPVCKLGEMALDTVVQIQCFLINNISLQFQQGKRVLWKAPSFVPRQKGTKLEFSEMSRMLVWTCFGRGFLAIQEIKQFKMENYPFTLPFVCYKMF